MFHRFKIPQLVVVPSLPLGHEKCSDQRSTSEQPDLTLSGIQIPKCCRLLLKFKSDLEFGAKFHKFLVFLLVKNVIL